MPETPHYTPGDSLNIEVRGKTPADEPPSRLVIFKPESANKPGWFQPWRVFLVPGGGAHSIEMKPGFEVYATCDMFAPDRPEAVGRFRSQAVRVAEPDALVEIAPVLGTRGDLVGLRLEVDKGPSDKLAVRVPTSLDRPVKVHVLQDGQELFEARVVTPGADCEFDTSVGFFFGFQVALMNGTFDLNAPGLPPQYAGFEAGIQELGTATSIDIVGSVDKGYTLELGRYL